MIVYFTRRDYNPFSWAVRKATGVDYSHVAIGTENTVYEAVLGGVRAVPTATFLKHNIVVDTLASPEDSLAAFIRARSKVGKAYDVPALFWFLFTLTAARVGIKVPKLSINPKWLICSEFVWYVISGKTETLSPPELHARIIALPPAP